MNTIKTKSVFILNFLKLYNMLWQLILPLLRKNKRLKCGFTHRVDTKHLSPADIWIQAASAGEAYLAVKLIQTFRFKYPTKILVTSITTQGIDILKENLSNQQIHQNTKVNIEWFLFDQPAIMQKAVKTINPKTMVLLETEIWPALLFYLKELQTKTFIINARLSKNSFKNYMRTKFLWRHFSPDHILATSEQDKNRYGQLFDTAQIQTMSNIKFEAFDIQSSGHTILENKIKRILPENFPLTILASIRKKEEPLIIKMIQNLFTDYPNQVVAIFPRHIQRISAWKNLLTKAALKFELRSQIDDTFTGPGIILWDSFGELKTAYKFAKVVFVGGSLKPYGGQNFIEPALQGAATVTGPYYDDFIWATEQVFSSNIVIKKSTPDTVFQAIVSALQQPSSRKDRIFMCKKYVQANHGGTQKACDEILKTL